MSTLKEDTFKYHQFPTPGKIETVPSKPCKTQEDLVKAYTPGVGEVVLELEKNPESAYLYTNKANLVAVLSNGTAILGLGDRGALASKPVMEGKGVLFKRFADVDTYDIEVNEKDPVKLVAIVKALEPTFGGINLEDIKAPECFYVETELKKICNIPVFHDDQHGTAIISAAGLMNACVVAKKNINEVKIVFNGAGAAGISIATYIQHFGVKKENITMCDTKGVIYKGREGLTKEKEELAVDTKARTLADALVKADVFIGVSVANCVSEDMIKSMAVNPIVFALANPDPEIKYEIAIKARPDLIMATGRSDYPNQINNVLGFPYIFRGALDVGARKITEGMKYAATEALAALTKEKVPKEVMKCYKHPDKSEFILGPKYVVPKPFDHRLIEYVALAVAKAACTEGVALKPITDWEDYRKKLANRTKKYR